MIDTMTKYQAEHLLGLTGTYTHAQFNKAYRKQVKLNHPDLGGDPDKMVQINNAKSYIEGLFNKTKAKTITCDVHEYTSTYDTTAYEDVYDTEYTPGWSAAYENSRKTSEERINEAAKRAARNQAYDVINDQVKTSYGWVSAHDNPDWVYNVGVPFEYAQTDNQFVWEKLNAEAEEYARKYYAEKEAAEKAATGNMPETDPMEYFKPESTVTNTNEALRGLFDWMAGRQYIRNVDNAPGWWSVLNWICGKFCWRIAFLLVCMIKAWGIAVASADPNVIMPASDSFTLIGLFFLCAAELPGLITNPIRWAMRKVLNNALNNWASSKGMVVDWDNGTIGVAADAGAGAGAGGNADVA